MLELVELSICNDETNLWLTVEVSLIKIRLVSVVMGSQHSHESGGIDVTAAPAAGSGSSSSRRGSAKSSGGGGGGGNGEEPARQEKPQPLSLVPVEKLAKLLAQRSQKEDGVNGITEKSFTKYIFPMYPELGRALYEYVARAGVGAGAGETPAHVSTSVFRHQCEKILAMLDDVVIIETYVRMFGTGDAEGTVEAEGFRKLLYTSYKISMDHYPDGPQTCLMINKTLSSVVSSCFNSSPSHSCGFVSRWVDQHAHRVLLPLHRYTVHVMSTRHRELAALPSSAPSPSASDSELSLATPVLSRGALHAAHCLSGSGCWLLAAALAPLYSRPDQPPPPPQTDHAGDHQGAMSPGGSAGSAMSRWLARLVCAVPSHWAALYCSRTHGAGANRFLHHTTGYRGPTLVVFELGATVVVAAATQEWRETHQYWGGPECALVQLYPTFSVIERAPKMMYLNTHIRGYPKGLRVGSDPRQPLLAVHEDFDRLTYQGIQYQIDSIEVWGCGDASSRSVQLDIKKWQVKEAERQRQIKISAADWIEHPDRYLLEMAGRPQYNNSNK